MIPSIIQTSFAAGELSPALFSRVDLAKFHIGAALLRNFFVDYRGGAISRPGTVFCTRCLYGDRNTRLIKFQFNVDQTYVLEFGDLYMRVIHNGGYVLEPSAVITAVTIAAPGVFTATAHGFANGDWIYLDGFGVEMRTLNTNTYVVRNVTANTFTLETLDGVAVSTVGLFAYTSGGTVARIFTLTTPYVHTDLALLKYVQANDVMSFAHPSYAPRDLTRLGNANWVMSSISFASSIAAPGGLSSVANGGAGSTEYSYVVTAISDAEGDESLKSSTTSVTGITFIAGLKSVKIDWAAVAGAAYYNVYRAAAIDSENVPAGALYGFIGSTEGTRLFDNNITPDFSSTPPKNKNPFNAVDKYPGVVSYFQQRKVFAATNKLPNTLWLTQIGAFKNMNASLPIRASDAMIEPLAAQESNPIKHLVAMPGGLVVLTGGGAWQISGDGKGSPISPQEFNAVPQAYNGSSDVPPIVTNYDILYIQALGSTVRDLAYNFFANIYTGEDMTQLSGHLFQGHTISEWTHAEEPHRLIWAVRDDGKMLAFTYVKEQNVYAWTQHDTDGLFKSVCAIPENGRNRVYTVVKRGNIQTVEYFAGRLVDELADAWCVDSGLRLNQPGVPFTVIQGLDHLEGKTVSILADGSVMPRQMVVGGQITLPHEVVDVIVGLPFTCQLQTLYIDTGDPTIQGKRKKIAAVTLRLFNSRGAKVGPSFDDLVEIKDRTTETYGSPILLSTGDHRIIIPGRWNKYGQISVQVDDPLPVTVLGVIPELSVGA